MPLYVPEEVLPIYPTHTTVVKDGVKYKAYFETDWHQVITEDGVPLCELLQSMPSFSANNFYKYRGTFKTSPEETAINQLYALTTQKNGDVYLVETNMFADGGKVCEAYVWLGENNGWVYCGTTNRKASMRQDLPEVVKLFPETLGKPNQVLIIGEDGKSIAWGDHSIDLHNEDPNAHQNLRQDIELKADKLNIFNDVLKSDGWVYNGEYPCFEYLYYNEKLLKNSYFELTTVVNSRAESQMIASSAISPVYKIMYNASGTPYTVLRAKRVPSADIEICIKCFGTFTEK